MIKEVNMILSKLELSNFRSFQKQGFEFSPSVTLIEGNNGVGKTNIIEAIHTLSIGKSFRADRDREMIRWGSEMARIQCSAEDTILEMVLTEGVTHGIKTPLKKLIVDGVPRRHIDFAGKIKTVLFWPEDLELVTDSPSLRRKYLDSVLVQTDREYRRNLMSYERGLRQRNRLLDAINEGHASRSQLLFWDQLLIKAGNCITDTRSYFIDFVNKTNDEHYRMEYDKSIISQARLEQYKDEEVAAKATLVGPHRDDFQFELRITNDKSRKNLSKYGSRGEQRLGVLWLKLGELSYIQTETEDRPILLLDDIFSELDDEHRSLVLGLISSYQTILTTAENDVVDLLKTNGIAYTVIKLP